MSQNEIKLPTGSDRNKIEALAEQIGQAGEAIKTLQASGAKIEVLQASVESLASANAPENLLKNSMFSERYRISGTYTPPGGERVHELKKMNFLTGVSIPIAPSWVVEFQDQADVRRCCSTPSNYSDYSDLPVADGGSLLFGADYGNSVLFQEFEMPVHIPSSRAPEGEKYHAYIRYCQTAGWTHAKFGVGRLDRHGNIYQVIASKVTNKTFNYQVQEEWLEIPSEIGATGDPNDIMRLVFFVEVPTSAVLGIEATGLYFGKTKQVPKPSRGGRGMEFAIPNTLGESKSFNCPIPMGTYKPEKHLCFAVYKPDASEYEIQAVQVDFGLTQEGKVQVSNVSPTCPTNSIICGFNVPNLKIKYFSLLTPLPLE
ncbi:hypothetical protein [Vibrio tarriae]|uniref:hypothetical protein n=1 Tax=Vibrio tarriae TaxID=2014742 RepID=UPI000DE25DA0|nr:hypothetical protein [Vibrio tarriae]EJL6479249.1 hypothetical protein [Vibrio cholerae]RBM25088.1 hypothetical protein DLR61_18390 [Vibrio tarriae]